MQTHRADPDPSLSIGSITAAVTAILALLVALGVPVSEELKTAILAVIATVVPLVVGLILRPRVTANSSVVERVEAGGLVVAGEANEITTGEPIRMIGSREAPDA